MNVLLGILFMVMFGLKVAGLTVVATWSWWIITAPLWIGLAVGLVIFAVLGVGAITIFSKSNFRHKK